MILEKPCEVITFYSYTGGAGRSMALANVACLLAPLCRQGRGVLMVDWSLQSASLHRYFQNKLNNWSGEPERSENKLDQQPGLFDLFVEIETLLPKLGPDASADRVFEALQPDRFVIPTDIPSLSLLKAGRFDDYFFPAVSSFQWAALHERAPWLIDSLAAYWAKRYSFVLIDSNSGVSELSGLCAMMLPDKLVTVFTPSRQSLLGVVDVARQALDYRKNSGDPRPLGVFPLPSKIETDEAALRHDWRFGGGAGEAEGYQKRFENLLQECDPKCDLDDYFADVQVPYVPRYGYGDEVAASSKFSRIGSPLVRAYTSFAKRLISGSQPWNSFDPEADLSVIELDGRMMPLAEAEEFCLREFERYVAGGDQVGAAASLEILASIKERLGRPAEAEAHYLEAVALCRVKQHDAGVASAVTGLARLERLLGRFTEARMYYLDASKIYRSEQSNAALASTLAILGDLDAQVGEMEAAAEHYREAVERYRAEWDDGGVARSLMSLGDLEKRLGNSDPAQEHYRQAAQLFHKERDMRGLARALSSLAEIQNREGKADEAEDNYSRAIELYRAERDGVRLAVALRCLADVRRGLKKIELALTHYQEAVDLFRLEGANLGLANALHSLAELEARSGRHADVKLHYEEAKELYRKEENSLGVANTLRSLGDLERRQGHYDASRSNYEQAMEMYREEKNNIGLANSLQSLGDLEKRLGKIADAEQRYTQAISIYRGEGASLGLANSLKSLGDVETEAGNLKVARDHYEQAIELYRTGGRTLGLANALQSLGDLERAQKRYKEAIAHYTTARDLYRLEKHTTGLAYTCSELARVSHALFDFAGSIEYLNEAVEAAKACNSKSVLDYVWGVQGEIRAKPAGVGK